VDLDQNPATPTPTAFFLLGPSATDARNTIQAPPNGTVPQQTPLLVSANMSYTSTITDATGGRTNDDRLTGVTVLLRRLANPHIPFDPNPTIKGVVNPWYNPYVTVDYMEKTPLGNALNPATIYSSRGKQQPFAGKFYVLSTAPAGAIDPPDPNSQIQNQMSANAALKTQQTFGLQNTPVLPALPPAQFDWLVHLDRALISPMELLQVSGYQPYQLTQNFIAFNNNGILTKFLHRAPWFSQSHRLYRAFTHLRTGDRTTGVSTLGGNRLPGKININMVWDIETFRALCDAQPSNGFYPAASVYNLTTSANPVAPGLNVVTPAAMSGLNPIPWQIQVNSSLLVDGGQPNQEIVQVEPHPLANPGEFVAPGGRRTTQSGNCPGDGAGHARDVHGQFHEGSWAELYHGPHRPGRRFRLPQHDRLALAQCERGRFPDAGPERSAVPEPGDRADRDDHLNHCRPRPGSDGDYPRGHERHQRRHPLANSGGHVPAGGHPLHPGNRPGNQGGPGERDVYRHVHETS
jgi:hypothetical protein